MTYRRDDYGRHGFSRRNGRAPEYQAWRDIRKKYNAEFPDFMDFLNEVGKRPIGGRLARIDRTKGWVPGNLKWSK